LGWAFAADRPGSRLEASCAGLAGGLLAAALLGALHSSYTSSSGNQRVIQALAVAIIVAVATFVGLRLPRESSAELLTPARAAPPAMNR
jgi:ABC-type uncharacterized transport system permease subunit